MVLGYLVFGVVIGKFAAAGSLFLGGSVLVAFAVYSATGCAAVILLMLVNHVRTLRCRRAEEAANLRRQDMRLSLTPGDNIAAVLSLMLATYRSLRGS